MKNTFKVLAKALVIGSLLFAAQISSAGLLPDIGISIGIGHEPHPAPPQPPYNPPQPPSYPNPYQPPAPPYYPPAPEADGSVCFYRDGRFSGAQFCVNVGDYQNDLANFGWNDQISSIRVFGNAAVTVYQDSNYQGPSLYITSDVYDFGGTFWNDRISSYSVTRRY